MTAPASSRSVERAAVDNTAFDGNAAMASCSSAACYESIAAGRRAGDPSLRSTWALPHHSQAGAPPNAAGVRNALARFSQTQGLVNSAEARSHLEAHMRTIQAQENSASNSGSTRDLNDAVKLLGAAIKLHQAHMDGTEPTSVASQQKLLDLLKAALRALGGAPGMASSPLLLEEARMGRTHAQENPAPPREDLVRAIYPGVDVRDAADGTPTLVGYFAKFNEWAEIDSVYEGRFMERIAPGTFSRSFAALTPKVLFQHGKDPQVGDKVLGIPDVVEEDSIGARYEVPMFDTSYNRDLIPGLRAGAYGASFRFSVVTEDVDRTPGRSDHNPGGLPERTITEAGVPEFGPVTFPAYAGATAGIRSLTDAFRPHDVDAEIGQLAREHPGELAAVIQKALKGAEDKPLEAKPQPTPRFRTREEYLEWMSLS